MNQVIHYVTVFFISKNGLAKVLNQPFKYSFKKRKKMIFEIILMLLNRFKSFSKPGKFFKKKIDKI